MTLEADGSLDNPTGPHNFGKEEFSDSILIYIFNEEGNGLLVDVEMVGWLPMEFWGTQRQLEEFEGDVFVEEVECATFAEPVNQITEGLLFEKPTLDMTKNLNPLYIKAHINGKPFNRVFVNGGAVLNIMSLATMARISKNSEDKTSYAVKLGRDWIHSSECVPSTLQ